MFKSQSQNLSSKSSLNECNQGQFLPSCYLLECSPDRSSTSLETIELYLIRLYLALRIAPLASLILLCNPFFDCSVQKLFTVSQYT